MHSSRQRTMLIAIALALGAVVGIALVGMVFFNAQFKVYHDLRYKFSIQFPRSWRVMVHPRDNVAVVFLRPKDTALDVLQENFNVTIEPVPEDIINVDQFTLRIKKQMEAVFGKSIRIVQDAPMAWGWRQGHKIIFEAPLPDHLTMVNAWVLSGDQAYIMTFLGDMRKYPQDASLVNVMIRSLQLQ